MYTEKSINLQLLERAKKDAAFFSRHAFDISKRMAVYSYPDQSRDTIILCALRCEQSMYKIARHEKLARELA